MVTTILTGVVALTGVIVLLVVVLMVKPSGILGVEAKMKA